MGTLSIGTIVEIAVLFLKLANMIIDWTRAQKYIAQGRDEEIARMQAESLRKSVFAKKVMEEIDAIPPAQVDDDLRSLEPVDSVRDDKSERR